MDKHYSLTGKNRIYRLTAVRPVMIGQAQGCDVPLPNNSHYEDAIFAKIAPDRDGRGWHLVRTDRSVELKVNGIEVNRVVYLNDGDSINADGHTFKFRIEDGERRESAVYNVSRPGKALWAVGAAVVLLALVFGIYIYREKSENLSASQREEIVSSLFSVRVDSIRLICSDTVADSYAYASGPVGTAFLTTDSLIVTARHCVQPWLNSVLPDRFGELPDIQEWPVAMALKAETENQLSGNTDLRMQSFMTLTDEEGHTFTLTSDDFAFNTELDDIVELGTYGHPMYWRSISHRYTRRDMMLGDVAVCRYARAGQIPLATEPEIRALLDHTGVKLAFFGYPEAGVTGNRLEYKTDELRLPLGDIPELPGRLFLLSHEGSLSPGFSGGPVIVRDGLGFKAVGVISVTDNRNGFRSYSVPTSEIK